MSSAHQVADTPHEKLSLPGSWSRHHYLVTVYVMDCLVPGIGLNTDVPIVHETIVELVICHQAAGYADGYAATGTGTTGPTAGFETNSASIPY